MAGTKNVQVRDSQANNLGGLFDRLDIRTAGGATTLATFNITFGAAAAGVVSVTGVPITVAAAAGGVAAEARLYHSTNPEEISGFSVGTGGEDVVVSNTNIAAAQDVTLNSFTLTEPAATQ